MATLINGNGNPAVYAAQDADWFASIMGAQTARTTVGSQFDHELEDANTIAVSNGVIVTKEGRRVQLDAGSVDEFTIPTGSQDTTRYYIIGYHLYTDGSSNQLCETFVQLMNNASETIPENTFRAGATEVYISLKRVKQEGLTITEIEDLLPLGEDMQSLKMNSGKMADDYDATSPYVAGENFMKDGVYYEVIAPISAGDPLVLDSNVKVSNPGTQITAINLNLTKINTTTKTLWGYVNGVWTNLHIKAYYDSIPIWVDGAFGIEVDNGIYHSDATGTPEPYVPEDTLLKFNLYANYQASLVSHDLIDFSAYSKLKVTINTGAEYQVDISDVSTSGYVFVYTSITSSTAYFGMGVSATKNAFYTNRIKGYTTTSATSSNFFIRQIVLE